MVAGCQTQSGDETMNSRGFTLVELMLTIMLLASGSLALFKIYFSIDQGRADAEAEFKGAQAGQALLETIISSHFSDPDISGNWGPESGESQLSLSSLDDIDDFDGYRDTLDLHFHATSAYPAFCRAVQVDTVSGITDVSPDPNLKRVVVSVNVLNRMLVEEVKVATLVARPW